MISGLAPISKGKAYMIGFRKTKIIILLLISFSFLGKTRAVEGEAAMSEKAGKYETAVFGGGCFWCMQPPFDALDGVISTRVGYCGGDWENPSYEDVCTGKTGHTEAIEVVFDPSVVSYERLLEVFWRNIDPTTLNRQFADTGTQYRTAVFYRNEGQKKAALKSKKELDESGKFDKPVVTAVEPATVFYEAESYHQDYYMKNSIHYEMYKKGSGREDYLKETWGNGK